MFNGNSVVAIIRKKNSELKVLGVKKIGIFGSFARREQHHKSDIDVLVEFQRGQKRFDNYMDVKFMLESLFRRKVDLVMKGSLKPRIKEKILKEVIYA